MSTIDDVLAVLTQADERETVFIAALDLGRVRTVRRELPLLAHRRTDLYRLEWTE